MSESATIRKPAHPELVEGQLGNFLAEIHARTPRGEWIMVQHHPDGAWSVANGPALAPEAPIADVPAIAARILDAVVAEREDVLAYIRAAIPKVEALRRFGFFAAEEAATIERQLTIWLNTLQHGLHRGAALVERQLAAGAGD